MVVLVMRPQKPRSCATVDIFSYSKAFMISAWHKGIFIRLLAVGNVFIYKNNIFSFITQPNFMTKRFYLQGPNYLLDNSHLEKAFKGKCFKVK